MFSFIVSHKDEDNAGYRDEEARTSVLQGYQKALPQRSSLLFEKEAGKTGG